LFKKFILKDTLRYGWLLGHYAIRSLMFQQSAFEWSADHSKRDVASEQAKISPLRLGFTGTLKIIRRAIPDFQDLSTEQLPLFSHG
jgi:hypothetical protein